MEKSKTQKNKVTTTKSTTKTASVKKVRPLVDMNAKVYNQDGKDAGTVELPKTVFDVKWNDDLVHQVMLSMQSNARAGTAHTKNRGDVRGGGKKPWAQKGTGRARHGSSRSPIWRGGGVTFGPTNEKNYSRKINKKTNTKALYTVLSQKYRDNELLLVDSFELKEPKSKDARNIVSDLSNVKGFEGMLSKRKNSLHIALGDKDKNVEKSFNNFGNIQIGEVRNLNILNILNYKYLVISNPDKSIEFLTGKKGVEKNNS